MEKKKKSANKIIIVSIICIFAFGVASFFIYKNFIKKDFMGNSHFPNRENNSFPDSERRGEFPPINETIELEITSFFESSPSSSEIEEYCNENLMYCMHYCREINPNDSLCGGLINNNQMPSGGESPND